MNKFFLSIIFASLVLIPDFALAQTQTREIGVSPFLQELAVAKGSSDRSSIVVSNNGTQELTITISTKDFLPGDQGEAIFVPDTEFNDFTFSLASWISIEGSDLITLAPQSSKEIFYKITPPVDAEPGTHYGAVLFSYSENSKPASVGITQSIGTIVLVNYGEARSEGKNNFTVDHNFEFGNNKFRFINLFSNTGNVHVKPKGEIEIKNLFGQVVGTSFVNPNGDNVLPKSDRIFISEWNPNNFLFGPYRANLVLTYGKEKIELTSEQILWVFPVYSIVILVVLLGILIWLIYHLRRWYRRKIIDANFKSNK
jgi:hypothetical protein